MREPCSKRLRRRVLLGHAQEAIDALNAYAATSSKQGLLLERGRAYHAAHQLAHAAKGGGLSSHLLQIAAGRRS